MGPRRTPLGMPAAAAFPQPGVSPGIFMPDRMRSPGVRRGRSWPTNRIPVGEQSNAYRILLRYDRKSRHRRIKKQRRYERLAATSQLSLPYGPGAAKPRGSIIARTFAGNVAPRLICGPCPGHGCGPPGQYRNTARTSSHLGALARLGTSRPGRHSSRGMSCHHREKRW